MLVRMSQDDCRCILGRNVRQICARWNDSEIGLWQKGKLGRLSVFNTDEMKECEQVIEMIKELSVGVNGFNKSEIADILSFISKVFSRLKSIYLTIIYIFSNYVDSIKCSI